ncbi:TetR/AcrR family transcriptional regulator [Cetobacterium somerae]|uniref:TetR/AcrR family transcriptional regulator n=1 Tax=Cetobacterium somerae TaxID=188913 RepID=UPI00211E91C1|nr:TetR/AcrR family transcriptional regulator [Cetobacterium somerae]MCQ9627297.1 TetR/AcrR family transcriptional regulator [Cetobacterium somerae]
MIKTKNILANTLINMLKDKEYKNITITDIALKANINRSTYYRNFSTKDEVITFYFSNILKEFLKKIDEENEIFENYIKILFTHYFDYKEELILIYKNELFFLFLKSLKKILEIKNFKHLNIDSYYKIQYHSGGIYNFFSFWISRGMIEPPEKISEIALSFYPDELKKLSLFKFLQQK